MNLFRLCIAICIALTAFAFGADAQTTTDCPPEMVCISKTAAKFALEADDRAKALEAENKVLTQANADLKAEIARGHIELARENGLRTGCEKGAVRDGMIIEILVKNSRKKSVGLIAF